MVTAAILKFLGAVLAFVIGLFPSLTVPSWWQSMHDWIAAAVGNIDAFANYLPVTALKYSGAFILACYAMSYAIRFLRIVQSSLTGGGGGG